VGDRHYLEQELHDRFRRDSTIFDFLDAGAFDGLWFWDVENPDQEWMSPRFKQTFGYHDHEIPNTSAWWQQNIHPDDLLVALDNFEKHCADPNHAYDQTVRYRHKDGSTVWVRCRGIALRNENGKPVRMMGVHLDVTNLKAAESSLTDRTEALEASHRRLENVSTRLETARSNLSDRTEALAASNRELESFAFAASHDLREPLRTLVSYSSLLEQDLGDDLSEDVAQDLHYIVQAANRMDSLIDDLLALSRTGRRAVLMEDVDIEDCVQDSLDALNAVVRQTHAEIVRDPLPSVLADRFLLEELYRQLIANSLKFVPEGVRPSLRLTAEQRDSEWVLGVRDNGIGIDDEHADKVFEPFERLHGLQEYDGSGIGLAICKRAVERMGGRIWVDREAAEGAYVRFTLSAAEELDHV